MNTTRTGKIARLSQSIRDQIGRRIEDGEPGTQIVEWLNSHIFVKETLEKYFQGRPITEQNFSDWKQGGHQDWLRFEKTREFIRNIHEDADTLRRCAHGQLMSDQFGTLLASRFAELAETIVDTETDPEKRWQRLCQIHREISRLRRDDHQATRTSIKSRQFNWQMLDRGEGPFLQG